MALSILPPDATATTVSTPDGTCRLLEDVQDLGVRVSVVSTTKTSPPMVADSLRRTADIFIEMEGLRDDIARPSRQNNLETS
ncbi:hypothetical protein OBB02_03335 [Candidatus Puniceispirillum sp.]|nr:hypothetical protein [Candidatus Puniceispirillum sp.]